MPVPIDSIRFFTIIEGSIKRGKSIIMTDYSSELMIMPCYDTALDWYSKYHQFVIRDAYHIRVAYQWMLDGFEEEVRAKAFDPDNNQQIINLYLKELLDYFNRNQILKTHYETSGQRLLDISYQRYYNEAVKRLRFTVGNEQINTLRLQAKQYSPFLHGGYRYSVFPDIEYYQEAAQGASLVITNGAEIVNLWLERRLTENKECISISTAEQQVQQLTKQKPVKQATLALFYYYCHETKCLPAFEAGKIVQSYKDATSPYNLAYKPFQQFYNRFSRSRRDRFASENRASLRAVIPLLIEYHKALEMAEDELKIAESSNPIR